MPLVPTQSVCPSLRRLRTHWILDNSSQRMAACPHGPVPFGPGLHRSTASRAGKPDQKQRGGKNGIICLPPARPQCPRNCSRAVSRLSTISRARTSGSGRLSESSERSSLNQKMSRPALQAQKRQVFNPGN